MRLPKLLIPIALLAAPVACATASASPKPILETDQPCYTVGQAVKIAGIGFAPLRMYQVSVDGLNFGTSTTSATGGFTASLRPGGLGANVVQAVHVLAATDGTSETRARFTVTRTTGARVIAGAGAAATLRAPFQVWGFALSGIQPAGYSPSTTRLPVYVHYLSPHKRLKKTVKLGYTGGQCGYLKTKARRLFPFVPTRGNWTLLLDANSSYSKHPAGPRATIEVHVS